MSLRFKDTAALTDPFLPGVVTFVTRETLDRGNGEPIGRPTSAAQRTGGRSMIGILIAVIFAAIVYLICIALGLPYAVALIAALLVLLVGFFERDRFVP